MNGKNGDTRLIGTPLNRNFAKTGKNLSLYCKRHGKCRRGYDNTRIFHTDSQQISEQRSRAGSEHVMIMGSPAHIPAFTQRRFSTCPLTAKGVFLFRNEQSQRRIAEARFKQNADEDIRTENTGIKFAQRIIFRRERGCHRRIAKSDIQRLRIRALHTAAEGIIRLIVIGGFQRTARSVRFFPPKLGRG